MTIGLPTEKERKPYPAYKDSGVEWLGEIPRHWDAKRLKFVAPARISKLDAKPDDTIYIGLEHVESWTGRLLLDNQPETVDSVVASFQAGDVLFGKLRPYLAKAARPHFDGVCTSEILPLRPTAECFQSYVMYCLLNAPYIRWLDSLTYGTKMPRVSPEQVGSSSVPVPPNPEQRAIAAFLDRETAKIDALVAKKERLIEILQEKRAALITQAVTKGLDPAVPMKDSGVGWLGQIPAHWKIKRLKFAATLQTGLTLGKDYAGRQMQICPYLRVANVQDGYLDLADVADISVPSNEIERYELQAGDVLMTEGGDFDKLGRGSVWEGQIASCLHQNHIFAVRPNSNLLISQYLAALMTSSHGKSYFTSTSQQTTNLATTNAAKLMNFVLLLPSIQEQNQILECLRLETARLDSLIAKVHEGIARLKEYRTALISSAVTGKIDVRGTS